MSFDQAEQNKFYDPEVLPIFWVKKDSQSTYILAGLVWLWLRGMVWVWLWGGVWGGDIYSLLCQLIYSSQFSSSSAVCLQVSSGPGSWQIWWGQENTWESITTHTGHNTTLLPHAGFGGLQGSCRGKAPYRCSLLLIDILRELQVQSWPGHENGHDDEARWGYISFSLARLKQIPEKAPYPRLLCCFQELDEYYQEARRRVWWCMETLPSYASEGGSVVYGGIGGTGAFQAHCPGLFLTCICFWFPSSCEM